MPAMPTGAKSSLPAISGLESPRCICQTQARGRCYAPHRSLTPAQPHRLLPKPGRLCSDSRVGGGRGRGLCSRCGTPTPDQTPRASSRPPPSFLQALPATSPHAHAPFPGILQRRCGHLFAAGSPRQSSTCRGKLRERSRTPSGWRGSARTLATPPPPAAPSARCPAAPLPADSEFAGSARPRAARPSRMRPALPAIVPVRVP